MKGFVGDRSSNEVMFAGLYYLAYITYLRQN